MLFSGGSCSCDVSYYAECTENFACKKWHRPAVRGVDADLGTHPGAEYLLVFVLVDTDSHRYPLHHLHPVTSGVLSWNYREFASRTRTDAQHSTGEGVIREGIDLYVYLLPRMDMSQFRFLEVGFYPETAVGNKTHDRRSRLHMFAGLGNLTHPAPEWCPDNGPLQLIFLLPIAALLRPDLD